VGGGWTESRPEFSVYSISNFETHPFMMLGKEPESCMALAPPRRAARRAAAAASIRERGRCSARLSALPWPRVPRPPSS
jgi:hypothetical protein